MKRIMLWWMKRHINKIVNDNKKRENITIAKAYVEMLKSYRTTVMFLEAEISK